MNVFGKKVFIIILLLINQAAFADNRQGHGRSKSLKRQKNFSHSHSMTKSQSVYQVRRPKKRSSSRYLGSNNYYRPGYSTRYLPRGFGRLFVKNMEYFFFDGYFYRSFHNEYRIVDAPVGAIVLSLPRLHFFLQWNGMDYFLAGNTYYRPHPNGYIVVRNPGFRDSWR